MNMRERFEFYVWFEKKTYFTTNDLTEHNKVYFDNVLIHDNIYLTMKEIVDEIIKVTERKNTKDDIICVTENTKVHIRFYKGVNIEEIEKYFNLLTFIEDMSNEKLQQKYNMIQNTNEMKKKYGEKMKEEYNLKYSYFLEEINYYDDGIVYDTVENLLFYVDNTSNYSYRLNLDRISFSNNFYKDIVNVVNEILRVAEKYYSEMKHIPITQNKSIWLYYYMGIEEQENADVGTLLIIRGMANDKIKELRHKMELKKTKKQW